MDFKQLVMNESPLVFRDMANGNTAAPLSKPAVISSFGNYEKKRDMYQARLNAEKEAFNRAIRTVNNAKKARLETEAQRARELQLKKETSAARTKTWVFWGIVLVLVVINCFFATGLIEYPLVYLSDDSFTLKNWWGVMWPAWIAISASLIATAIVGVVAKQDSDNTTGVLVLEVIITLLYALVVSCIIPNDEVFIADLIVAAFCLAIAYVVPVVVGGAIAIGLCQLCAKE